MAACLSQHPFVAINAGFIDRIKYAGSDFFQAIAVNNSGGHSHISYVAPGVVQAKSPTPLSAGLVSELVQAR